MADNINVNPVGSTPIATEELGGVHYQKVMQVNETGSIIDEGNWLVRALMKVFGRFSFDTTSALRISGATSVSGSLTTVTTVGTVGTGNIGFGDQGKASAAMSNSASMYYNSVRRNFI